MQRKSILQTKEKKILQRIPLVVTYNRTLHPLGPIIDKHWYILQSDPKMEEKFSERPILASRRCKNLRDMTGSNTISSNKVVKPSVNSGKCKPCLSKSDCHCRKQLIQTRTFSSQITKETYDIRHNFDCLSSKVIHLKMWSTVRWKIRNIIKHQTQQPQERYKQH